MISPLNNTRFSNRRASVDMTVEAMPGAIQVLMDAGFEILGSLASDPLCEGTVRLLIKGSALPAECEFHQCSVIVLFQQESYGSQKITRVSEVIRTTFQRDAA